MKKIIVLSILFVCVLTNCLSTLGLKNNRVSGQPAANTAIGQNPQQTDKEIFETQVEQFKKIFAADIEKIKTGSDNRAISESIIEGALHPKVVSSSGEILSSISEPGKPYYFKLRSIYKGYDKDNKKVRLQDLGAVAKDTILEFLTAIRRGQCLE